MDFIAIDFETATSERYSPCEIGLTFVNENNIIETKSWLIKPYSFPYFDNFNVMIHGITPDDVADKPEFPDVWEDLKPLIEKKFLIAHNAGFDFSVLRWTLDYYNIKFPDLKYSCSYIFSKKVWEGLPAYDLKTLCKHNDIELNHHRAGADSEACAKLAIKAFEKTNTKSIDEFPEKLKTTIGQLYDCGYKPALTKRASRKNKSKKKDLPEIIGDPSKINRESLFFGKNVVFTGTLSSMKRREAQQIIADIGGINDKSVNNSTDFLVVGQQDYRIVGEDGMSSKQEKAMKLIEKGLELEILSEADFLKNL
jgi:DNA polymerase-3 subunit epsilon